MPIYEYGCRNCGAISEEIRAIESRDDNCECKHCGGVAVFLVVPTAAYQVGNSSGLENQEEGPVGHASAPDLGVQPAGILVGGHNSTYTNIRVINSPVGVRVFGAKGTTINNLQVENVDRAIEVQEKQE